MSAGHDTSTQQVARRLPTAAVRQNEDGSKPPGRSGSRSSRGPASTMRHTRARSNTSAGDGAISWFSPADIFAFSPSSHAPPRLSAAKPPSIDPRADDERRGVQLPTSPARRPVLPPNARPPSPPSEPGTRLATCAPRRRCRCRSCGGRRRQPMPQPDRPPSPPPPLPPRLPPHLGGRPRLLASPHRRLSTAACASDKLRRRHLGRTDLSRGPPPLPPRTHARRPRLLTAHAAASPIARRRRTPPRPPASPP